MNELIRNRIFYLLCLTMPFLFVPKFLHLSFIGGPINTMLMVYVILVAYVYSFYCYKKDKDIFANKEHFIKFIILYMCVLVLSLIHGLLIYPYYDLIFNGPVNQIERLYKLINFLNEYDVIIDKNISLSVWMIVSFFKGIIFEIIYTFGFSYILYCSYKDEPQVAIKIIKKSIYIISIIIVLFGFIELFFLLGYEWAKNFLIKFTPYLHEIKMNFEWWPPLLLPGRMRNIFPEPSQFGMYTAFAMPFLWAEILNGNKKLLNLTLVCIISLFIFLTQAKTAVLLFLGELFLLTIYVLYKRILWKKYIQIFATVIIASILSLWCIDNYGNNSPDALIESYIDQNVIGVVNPNSGSNGARFAIIKSDIRIWQDHILLGVGSGLKSAYTTDYLTVDELKNGELLNCKSLQEKNGILKSGYPGVNEFSMRLAQSGIVGFVMYVFPFLFLIYKFYKNRKNYNLDFKENNNVICMLIALIGCFVTGMSGMLTTIQTYWLLLGIAYAYLLTIENTKCKSVEEK